MDECKQTENPELKQYGQDVLNTGSMQPDGTCSYNLLLGPTYMIDGLDSAIEEIGRATGAKVVNLQHDDGTVVLDKQVTDPGVFNRAFRGIVDESQLVETILTDARTGERITDIRV